MTDTHNHAYEDTNESCYDVPGPPDPPSYYLSIINQQQPPTPKPKPIVSSMDSELSPKVENTDVRSSSTPMCRMFLIIIASLIIGGVIGGTISYLLATRQDPVECFLGKNNLTSISLCPTSPTCPTCRTCQRCQTCPTVTDFPVDCQEVMDRGNIASGEYMISPLNAEEPFPVWCDMETDGGGWTVFQRRKDGSVDFYLGWFKYINGFGDVNSEHWLGNQKIYRITSQGEYELRIDLSDFEGNSAYAEYSKFKVGGVHTDYLLTVGGYSGDAGDSFSQHNNRPFTTKDVDNDHSADHNCASFYEGAWWYDNCHHANLNGVYLGGKTSTYGHGVVYNAWKGWYYSLKVSVMKMRRIA